MLSIYPSLRVFKLYLWVIVFYVSSRLEGGLKILRVMSKISLVKN